MLRGSVAFALTSGALGVAIAIAVLSRVFVTAPVAAAMVVSVVASLATLALARIALARAIVLAVVHARPRAGWSRGSVAFALTSGALGTAIAVAVLSRVFVDATAVAAMVVSVVAALATLALARGLCVHEVASLELLKKHGID